MPLNKEDKQLWQKAIEFVKPLKLKSEVSNISATKKISTSKNKENTIPINRAATLQSHHLDRPLVIGSTADISRATRVAMDRGEIPIDATIDLHGMTHEKAFNVIINFIENSYLKGLRLLLIITGKGDLSKDSLRSLFPRWLDQHAFKNKIVRICYASNKHGGNGAYYALLKRRI